MRRLKKKTEKLRGTEKGQEETKRYKKGWKKKIKSIKKTRKARGY